MGADFNLDDGIIWRITWVIHHEEHEGHEEWQGISKTDDKKDMGLLQ